MAIEVFNRYEKKFLLTQSTYEKFVDMISEKMEADAYSKDGGFYRICNIYYDTPNDELIRKSIDGPVIWRLRKNIMVLSIREERH